MPHPRPLRGVRPRPQNPWSTKPGFKSWSGSYFFFPYAKLDVKPTPEDPLVKVCVDRELGNEAFTLLDTTNYRKSVRKMLALLHALNCDVELVVHQREAV